MGLAEKDLRHLEDETSIQSHPWDESQLISFVTHPGVGRVLCIGNESMAGVKETLSMAHYEIGELSLSTRLDQLPHAASTFLPDLVYVALGEPRDAALQALASLSSDARTESLPVVALIAQDADDTLLDAAYTQSGCDFFRIGNTNVELLARTHLLVRMFRPNNRLIPGASFAQPFAPAANDPAVGVDVEDQSTGLYSARYFLHRLPTEVSRARRYQRDLSILAIRFDQELSSVDSIKVSKVLRSHLRSPDVASRIEENLFALILPEAAPEQLSTLQLRIVEELTALNFRHGFGRAGVDDSASVATPLGFLEKAKQAADDDLKAKRR